MDSKVVITKPNMQIEITKNTNIIEIIFNYQDIDYYSFNLLKHVIIASIHNTQTNSNNNTSTKKYRVIKEYFKYKEIISHDLEDLVPIFISYFDESEIEYLRNLLLSLNNIN